MNASRPTTQLRFGIRDWFAWRPSLETRADWLQQAGQSYEDKDNNPISALPMMLRRRLSGFGQKIIGAALATPQGVADGRYIFASRHGEFATTLRILEALAERQTPSPADFSLSVHHALAGLLSIQTGNKAGHTTLSAGLDTFGYGLLEAVTTLAENPTQPALLVSYDEPLPSPYDSFKSSDEAHLPLIVVLDLVVDGEAGAFTLAVTEKRETSAKALSIPMGQRFLDFFLSDRPQIELVGDTLTWVLNRVG